MNRTMLILLLLVLACTFSSAQNRQGSALRNGIGVRPLEVELRFPAVTNPLGNIEGVEATANLGFGIEFRYNLDNKTLPLDFGLGYEASATSYYETDSPYDGWMNPSEKMNIVSAYTDWNFRQAKKFNPFIGFGTGIAYCETENLYSWDEKSNPNLVYDMGEEYQWNPVFIPRIGFEAWAHVRVSAYLLLCKKGLSNFSVSAGWTIGGGRKPWGRLK